MAKKPSQSHTPTQETPNVIFNIRVYLLNPEKRINGSVDFEIAETNEISAFNKLPAEVKKIHDGEWIYAGYFKICKK